MSPRVPLNLFQRLLRQWDRVHPYNAGQLMQLRGSLDPSRVTAAWHEAMRSLGLGTVRIGRSSFTYDAQAGPWRDRPITCVPCAADLPGFLSDQLNAPFADPEEPPFRPFIACEGDTYRLGVVYQHWLADSVSIRMLMREWFYRLYDPASAARFPVRHATSGYWNLFGPHASNWPFVVGLCNTFRRYFRYRRVMKIDSSNINDPIVHVQLQELPGVMGDVLTYARASGVKVNDVFVATMADLCRRFVPLQRRGKRQDVAVGSIVDLRPMTNQSLRDVFGIFLGFSSAACTPRDFQSWESLLHSVATQHRLGREYGMTQTSLIWMLSAVGVGYFANPKKLFHFYRKDIPLAGGVSNVNLNSTWVERHHPDPIISYARISPAGPMTPIVFSTTTLGQNLQLSVTFRRSLLDDERANTMAGGFFDRLKSLTLAPSPGTPGERKK
jgi:hypothetical protein